MGVIEDVKEIGELIKKYNNLELNRKIISLEGEVHDLSRDKRRLETRVEELEASLAFKETLVAREPFLWVDGEPTPYCQACWDTNRKAIRVVLIHDDEGSTRRDCPNCKQVYLIRKNPGRHIDSDFTSGGPNSWMGS